MSNHVHDAARFAEANWLPPLGPYSCFGRRWWIRTTDRHVADLIAALYADLHERSEERRSLASDRADATFSLIPPTKASRAAVYRDQVHLGRGKKPASALGSLVWGINRWVLDQASHERLLLHAAGVVREDGVAVALAAPSGAGKSTLTAGLLERGLGYLSDEAIAVRDNGYIDGYPKPISIDQGAWPILAHHRPDLPPEQEGYLGRQWHLRASSISYALRTAVLGILVLPQFDPQAATTKLTLLSPREALVKAASCTFAPGSAPTLATWQIRLLARVLSKTHTYELRFPDLDGGCRTVLKALQRIPHSHSQAVRQ